MNIILEKKKELFSRVDYIDIARAIGIIFVLYGHTVDSNTIEKNVLYSFHMPLFFVLSGMVYNGVNRKITWKEFLHKKMVSLIIPYFVWGFIYSSFSFKNMAFILYGTRETLIRANCLTSLWFLTALFLGEVLVKLAFDVMIKLKKNLKFLSCIWCTAYALIGFFMPHNLTYGNVWGIDIAFTAAAFMLAGWIVRPMLDMLYSKRTGIKGTVTLLLVILFCICVKYSNTPEGYVLMANAVYGSMPVFYLNAFLGSFTTITCAMLVAQILCIKKRISYIGKNTLGIFLLHKPFVELLRRLSEKMGMDYNFYITTIMIVIVTLVICCVALVILEKYLPEAIGKKGYDKDVI